MSEYRVLARKYRPQTFDDLVGQEVLVRTLSNAIKMGRLAHAFLLTGIRGIGKTTTARIIARALNCIGEDGTGGATTSPCGVCANCVQIREDRHPDVLEMDAASRTGVGDIRELIEKVQYAPTLARYKVFIIDEVHMLSNSAFNALLKTLEEPPPQVIFIFATTETRKIPVTILSRCQRFDLKRLDVDQLTEHLQNICGKEQVQAEEAALRLIAMAAEGSVRDALSLLDRAIAHGLGEGEQESAAVTELLVRGMLGLADRTRLFAMLECLFAGEISDALSLLRQQYRDGMDMTLMLQDMLGLVHTITRLCINKKDDLGVGYAQSEKDYALRLAGKLSVASLSRAWQMLIKGLDEVRRAPDALTATEMVCIRFAYSAELPDPTELVKKIRDQQTVLSAGLSDIAGASGGGGARAMANYAVGSGGGAELATEAWVHPDENPQEKPKPHLVLAASNPVLVIETFEDVLAACEGRREAMLLHQLTCDVALVSCVAGELVLSPEAKTGDDGFRRNLNEFLRRVTEKDWAVRFEKKEGLQTIQAMREAQKAADLLAASEHPLTQRVMAMFPDAQIMAVK